MSTESSSNDEIFFEFIALRKIERRIDTKQVPPDILHLMISQFKAMNRIKPMTSIDQTIMTIDYPQRPFDDKSIDESISTILWGRNEATQQ